MASWFNLSGTISAFKILRDPSLCLPHCTIPTFAHLTIPISMRHAPSHFKPRKMPSIRAVVLDKDNCFAIRHQNDIFSAYKEKFAELRAAYPGSRLLIVSNTAGTNGDPDDKEAHLLESNTGVTVLRHSTKKPGCYDAIMDHFYSHQDSGVTAPSQVAIVGDRLLTDMIMANIMGAYGIWTRDGVAEAMQRPRLAARLEGNLALFLQRKGYEAPFPAIRFEDAE